MKRAGIICCGVVAIAAALVSAGYVMSVQRGYVYLPVTADAAAFPENRVYDARIELIDEEHKLFARARTGEKWAATHIRHPDLGYCDTGESHPQRSECQRLLGEWTMSWADRVAAVRLDSKPCGAMEARLRIQRQHVGIFTWWVPLPHIGGRPYSYYSARITLNTDPCKILVG